MTRGFNAMDTARQREIAALGGKAAHAKGTAHQYTATEAVAAARKSVWLRRIARHLGVTTRTLRQMYRDALDRHYAEGASWEGAVAALREAA